MTAKDVQQSNAELRRLIIEGGMEAQPARVIRAAMQDHATELRAALAPFDPNAGTVEQHQHARLHGAWVDCNKATSDRAAADGLEVRIVYLPATPEK